MAKNNLRYLQDNAVDKGRLQISVTNQTGFTPIEGARIRISYTGEPGNILEEVQTDTSGQTATLAVNAPPLEYSMEPSENQPYSQYTVQVEAEGYRPIDISGVAVLPEETALQKVALEPLGQGENVVDNIVIPANTLFGNYPAKIAEAEIKPVTESGEIVLSRVVIPEYIVVHDGAPSDNTANNYYVRYRDYIKNVASSEIYATWPDATLRANILAIMSFTLNRVYTEWYRNKGYEYTITSSTAFDHKFVYGRNIYSNISRIVDEMFQNYLSRPNVRQPILTQYCDGERVTCSGWMTQWGSKYLGDQNYSAIEILRYFYGNDMYINVAEEVSGIPASWPGYDLELGVSGSKVRTIQEQINRIAKNYPAIPTVTVDGVYGPSTKRAIEVFQSVFGLPVSGIVDFPTWYRLSEIYVGVSRIAELR
ncbi:MAG: peptidoglycan-binding protein [Lachnospiraceae bacterium]|uniref:peptidoglycan-binding protein n=1 Tax=Roseburia hominis TaxID=301301 RepID=UPI001F26620B|nr:peptidoglycan-binding protein [Roseburia hominis]MDD6170517.1 peptidoglycan-binding protein [Lachnospiraceae bacterium]MDY4838223.1 peptidoglycan-binding protein [Lachnospiraceae bacterium]